MVVRIPFLYRSNTPSWFVGLLLPPPPPPLGTVQDPILYGLNACRVGRLWFTCNFTFSSCYPLISKEITLFALIKSLAYAVILRIAIKLRITLLTDPSSETLISYPDLPGHAKGRSGKVRFMLMCISGESRNLAHAAIAYVRNLLPFARGL